MGAPTLKVVESPISNDWDWIKPLLDATIERDQPLWVEPKKHMRGSGVGAECVRAMTLDMLGHRVPFAAHTLRIFRVGNLIEQANVEVMGKAGILADTQSLAEYTDPPIIGHFDMSVFRRPGDGKIILGEMKSIKSALFNKLPPEHGPTLAGESPLMKTHASYVKQWTAYAGRELGGPPFDEGFILFEEKDAHRQKVYYLLFDIDLYDEMLAHVKEATDYVALDPPRAAPIPADRDPFSDKDRTCASCPKRYLCRMIPVEGATLDEVKLIDGKLRG